MLTLEQVYSFLFTLTEPQWQVKDQSGPLSLAGLDDARRGFRLLCKYQTGAEESEQLFAVRFFRQGGIN